MTLIVYLFYLNKLTRIRNHLKVLKFANFSYSEKIYWEWRVKDSESFKFLTSLDFAFTAKNKQNHVIYRKWVLWSRMRSTFHSTLSTWKWSMSSNSRYYIHKRFHPRIKFNFEIKISDLPYFYEICHRCTVFFFILRLFFFYSSHLSLLFNKNKNAILQNFQNFMTNW